MFKSVGRKKMTDLVNNDDSSELMIGESLNKWSTVDNLNQTVQTPSLVEYSNSSEFSDISASAESEYVPGLSTESDDTSGSSNTNEAHKKKVVLTKEKRKTKEKIIKRGVARPCAFCGKFLIKLKRHLFTVHKEEPDVKNIMLMSNQSKLRGFDLLRKKGIYNHNIKMLKENKPLIPERNQGKGDLKICSNCSGFFQRKSFHRHRHRCQNGHNESSSASGICVESITGEQDHSFVQLLSRFQNDEKGNLCRSDNMIKTVGKSQFQKHKRKTEKRAESRKAVMSNMRLLASIFLEFKLCASRNNITVTSESMLQREHFLYLEEAIQNIATHDNGTLKPALMVSIGNLLKITAKVMKGMYLINQQDDMAESVDKFESVLKLRWISNFGDAEYQVIQKRQSKLRQPSLLPNENDLKQLRTYTIDGMKQELSQVFDLWIPERYINLRNLVISRLTLFNARRGGEPSRLLLSDWQDAKQEKWIDKQRSNKLKSSSEIFLLENFKVMYQGGKGTSHLVPVLVPPDCIKPLDVLADLDIRGSCDINKDNKFLFPSTRQSCEHASGWHCTKDVADRAGVEKNITATQMRHRASTLYAELDIPESNREAFFRHMGHSAEMNKNVYQCPLAVQEVTQVGNYLANIDGLSVPKVDGVPRTHHGEIHCDSGVSNTLTSAPENFNHSMPAADSNSLPVFEESDVLQSTQYNETAVPSDLGRVLDSDLEKKDMDDEICSKKKGRRYTKWRESASESVCSYFQSYIEDTTSTGSKGALPSRKLIKEFLLKNPAILDDLDEKDRICATHAKIFNERNKFRRSYSERLGALTK